VAIRAWFCASENWPGVRGKYPELYIEATVNGIRIGSLYLPNGNPVAGPKFDHKLRWFERFRYASELLARQLQVVLAGDYNIILYSMMMLTTCLSS
jgi:exonuclease III